MRMKPKAPHVFYGSIKLARTSLLVAFAALAAARDAAAGAGATRLSGLEPLNIGPDTLFVNEIGRAHV